MKDKIIERIPAFFVCITVLLLSMGTACKVYAQERDAFVVEEEAAFGDEMSDREQIFPAEAVRQEVVEQQDVCKEEEVVKEKEQHKKEADRKPPEETVSLPEVSANTAEFIVPQTGAGGGDEEKRVSAAILKQEKRQLNIADEKKSEETAGKAKMENSEVTMVFLTIGSICLVFGIIRIVRRLRIGYGKL